MKAWMVQDKWECYGAEIVFAETRGKARSLALSTDCCSESRLASGGSTHAKYRRMITLYVDVTAPLYWWKEFDTYKVGTVANSCSTMHKIHSRDLTLNDFSHEHLSERSLTALEDLIYIINISRAKYAETGNKDHWWEMIQLLPTSFNQKRTVMLNYEVLVGMYRDRKNHKLDEWRAFCKWIESLPLSEIITGKEDAK